ncbi:hypothetical protein BH20ACI1_BH20ACI1_23910 [soil metagenome]
MKIILALTVCLLFFTNLFAQSNQNDSEVGVEEISLARGDGNGEAGEITDKFYTTDVPIYCIIQLNSHKSANVKMNIVAVKADGYKPETKIIAVSYTTKENHNRVTFNASPEKFWSSGTYRVDILINGKIAESLSFEIEKQSAETNNKNKFAPNNKRKTKKPKN